MINKRSLARKLWWSKKSPEERSAMMKAKAIAGHKAFAKKYVLVLRSEYNRLKKLDI